MAKWETCYNYHDGIMCADDKLKIPIQYNRHTGTYFFSNSFDDWLSLRVYFSNAMKTVRTFFSIIIIRNKSNAQFVSLFKHCNWGLAFYNAMTISIVFTKRAIVNVKNLMEKTTHRLSRIWLKIVTRSECFFRWFL